MALTWGTLIVGAAVIFGLPLATFWLNVRRRNAGWWLLTAVISLLIVGNAAENVMTGSSPFF
ncbi:hypothetical protein [uncultured Sphingomonas sp.]|uniref:hypothetical protein n=1 Tax=uncultured Sphingomonas sp. TaxID=158754 RepID=UPI0025D19C1A|nr:hypothetical protein [uncultured Sphingomonas sp.]